MGGNIGTIDIVKPLPEGCSIHSKSTSEASNTRLHIILNTNTEILFNPLCNLFRLPHIHFRPIPHSHSMLQIFTVVTRFSLHTHCRSPIRPLVSTSPLRTATPSLRSQFFTHIQHSFTNYFQLAFSEFSDPFSIFAINLSIYHSLWRVYTEKYRNSGQKSP